MKKVLFFDIDGTLIDYGGDIPESAKNALIKARENGHQVVICTGRAVYQIFPHLIELADGVVASTGAFVRYKDEVIYEYHLPQADVKRMKDVLNASGAILMGQADDHMVISERSLEGMRKYMTGMRNGVPRFERVFGNAIITEELENYPEIKRVVYYDSTLTVDEVSEKLDNMYDIVPMSLKKETVYDGEIGMLGINKSYGIQKYIDYVGVKREDTFAFGDGPNDVDMLLYAGIGVAMGNARDDVKKHADFVTKDVNSDGIEYALKHFGLI